MFGNIPDLIYKVTKDGDSPIIKNIGEKTPTVIHTAIYTEFWKEVIKRKQMSPATGIEIPKLGVFDVAMSPLKKYIRHCIKKLRKYKVVLKQLEEQGYTNIENSRIYMANALLQEKLRIAWKQIEIKRKVIIIRTIAWNQKLRERGEEHRILIDYKPTQYSFVEYFVKYKKLPPLDF